MTDNWIERLGQRVMNDEYFKELFLKAELMYISAFISNNFERTFSNKELTDLLRFADILSNTNNSDGRNLAYRIISLLYDHYKEDVEFSFFSKSILIKVGNFPAIKFIGDKFNINVKQPLENIMEKIIKESAQAVPNSDLTFTDSQYKIYEAMINSNHFSFSGPTSLGKSFIMETYIKSIIDANLKRTNIAILVPTRALINQIATKLSIDLKETKYKILTHPIIPKMLKESNTNYIFVFTPERLVSYLSEQTNPKLDYLFVDEAQKIVADHDSRSPLFYHAIVQAEKKSIKLYFASPNIPNSEIFLELFNKSSDESITVSDKPVSQNRFFIDLVKNKATYFSEFNRDIEILGSDMIRGTDLNFWLVKLGKNTKNIIYCNTIEDTISYAISYANTLPLKKDPKLENLISEIKKSIHNDYYLIDCLEKGVAYHFGRLPQRIREKIEILYIEKSIDYLFCTSTLLEGVNLPAKNMFILSNAIGTSKFSQIDFWNLAGRAGRLTQELSGNIICIRAIDKLNRWNNPERDLEIIRDTNIKEVEPLLISGKKNFYQNVGNALINEPFTRKNVSFEQKNIWNHYSNIALIHHLKDHETKLKNTLIKKNSKARIGLEYVEELNAVPESILSVSSSIKQKYQNDIWHKTDLENLILPNSVNYDACLDTLKKLYTLYNWSEEESGGLRPLVKSKDSLKYLALIMNDWMNGKPLKLAIINKIKYHDEEGFFMKNNQGILFDKNDRGHINFLINSLISDIENKLRFTLRNYFLNYYLILKEKLGVNNSGANWADFLEYGTSDYRIIELQIFGLSRQGANYLIEHHLEDLEFEDNTLLAINSKNLLLKLNNSSIEYEEIRRVFIN